MSDWRNTVPLLGMLQSRAEVGSDEILLIAGASRVTYSDADYYASALSWHLEQFYGVSFGDRVIVKASSRPEYVVSLAAVQRSGAIAVPVRESASGGFYDTVAKDCGARLMLEVDRPASPTASKTELLSIGIRLREDLGCMWAGQHCLSREHSSKPWTGPFTESDIAFLLYTSGSTGSPRGVIISYSSHIAALRSVLDYLELPQSCTIVSAVQPSFDYGLYQYFYTIAQNGRHVSVRAPFLAASLSDELTDRQADVVPLVPTMLRALADHYAHTGTVYESVSRVTSTGSPLDTASLNAAKQIFPNAQFISMYGLTECMRVSYLNPTLLAKKPSSVGRSMPNCRATVRRRDGSETLPGEPGELVVQGPNVGNGYWGGIEASSTRFRTDVTTGIRTLATGDIFVRDEDGDLFFVGREDDEVKVQDQRFSLISVDRVLRQVPEVADACAFVTGEPRELAALVQLQKPLTAPEIRRRLRSMVEHRAMIPTRIRFVDSLPQSANGKLVRPGPDTEIEAD